MSDEEEEEFGGESWNLWAIVRRVLFWTVAVGIILSLLLMLLAVLFERRIAEAAIAAIKKQLRTEIKIEDYSFSLIRRFPSAVLYLKNVRVNAYGDSTEVATMQTLALKCNLFGIVTGNYDFHTVELHDGELDLYRNERGLTNFDVFQPHDGSFEPLPIKKIQLVNMRLRYRDEQLRQNFALLFNSGEIAHTPQDEEAQTPAYYQCSADLLSQFVMSEGDSLLVGNALAFSATLIERPDSNLYRFDDARLTFNGSKFNANGVLFPLRDSASQRFDGFEIDFSANSQECKWRSILPVVHTFCDSLTQPAESNSNLYAQLLIQGEWSQYAQPQLQALVGMRDGKFTHRKIPAIIRDVDFEWMYTNRDSIYEEEVWALNGFHARIDGQPVMIDYSSSGTHNPHISCRIAGGFSLGAFYEYLHKEATGGSGILRIDSLRIEGFYSDMLDPTQQARVQILGAVALQSATLAFGKQWINLEKGKFSLRGNAAHLEALDLQTDSTGLRINGNIANLLPYLLRDEDNSYDAKLLFNLGVTSEQTSMSELMRLYAQSENLSQHDWHKRLSQWQGRIVAQIGSLNWGKVAGKNIHSECTIENSEIRLHKFHAQAAEGSIQAIGSARLPSKSSEGLRVEAAARVENAQAARFMQLCGNFEQAHFTDKQVAGTLQMTAYCVAKWDSMGALSLPELSAFADIVLQHGEFDQPAPLAYTARESRISDLAKLRFVDCYAHLYIGGQALVLPRLYLRSSGYNLSAAVRQRFSGEIDAFLKYNSAPVLVSRLQSAQPQAEAPTRAKIEGIHNLYFHTQANAASAKASLSIGKTKAKAAMTAAMTNWAGNFGGLFSLNLQQLSAALSRDTALRLPLNALEEPASWGDLPAFGEEQ